MTEMIPPNEAEAVPGSSVTTVGGTTDADMVLSLNDGEKLTLHLGKGLKADVLDLSLKATPPGKYVRRSANGRVSWNDAPQYFSFNRIDQSKGISVYVVEEPGVASRLPFDSRVEIASHDGFFAASTVWKIRPRAGVIYRYRFRIVIVLLLVLGSMAAAALNFPQISDSVCARWSICLADQIAFQDVKSCSSQIAACSRVTCTSQFTSKFPSSRFIPLVKKIEQDGDERCRAEDEDKYEAVSRCVQERINADFCNVRACFSDYDMTKVSERVSQAQTIMAVAAERCRLATAAAAERKQPTPEPQQPAQEPRQPVPVVPLPMLADGSHPAIQRYIGPRSRLDPLNCPSSASFFVEVRGETFTYSRPDFFDGASITRTWVGTINQATGQIAVLGSKGNPPTKNAMTVVGAYDGATVMSDFCGIGTFQIER